MKMANQKTLHPLPSTYRGEQWSVQLLKSLSSDEVRRLIRTYGAQAVNSALREPTK
jgi:hypothetical protein